MLKLRKLPMREWRSTERKLYKFINHLLKSSNKKRPRSMRHPKSRRKSNYWQSVKLMKWKSLKRLSKRKRTILKTCPLLDLQMWNWFMIKWWEHWATCEKLLKSITRWCSRAQISKLKRTNINQILIKTWRKKKCYLKSVIHFWKATLIFTISMNKCWTTKRNKGKTSPTSSSPGWTIWVMMWKVNRMTGERSMMKTRN